MILKTKQQLNIFYMESQENEMYAMNYELFLHSAFRHDKRIRRAKKQELLNLISVENGGSTRLVGSIDKQLVEIRKRLFTAIKMLLSFDFGNSEKSELLNLLDSVDAVNNSQSIISIVEIGIIIVRSSRPTGHSHFPKNHRA